MNSLERRQFGKRLAAWRRTKRLKQTELAAQLGVLPGTLSRWEHGHYEPSVDQRKALDKALGAPCEEALGLAVINWRNA